MGVQQIGGELPLNGQVVEELRSLYAASMPSGHAVSKSIRKYVKGRLQAELKDEATVLKCFTIEGTLAAWVYLAPTPPNSSRPHVHGMVMLQPRPDLGPAAAELKHLCVAPHLQRQGVGRMLLAAATRWAGAAGYTAITLSTVNIMVAAQAFYRAAGFSRVEHAHAADAETMHYNLAVAGTPRTATQAAAAAAAVPTATMPTTGAAGKEGASSTASAAASSGPVGGTATAAAAAAATATAASKGPNEKNSSLMMPTWATGSLVRLTHCVTGSTAHVIVEMEKASGPHGPVFKMARPSHPYAQLHVSQAQRLSWGGKGARYATFVAIPVQAPPGGQRQEAPPEGARAAVAVAVALRSMGNVGKTNRTGSKFWHLVIPGSAAAADFAEAVEDGGVGADGGEEEAESAFYVEELQRSITLQLAESVSAAGGGGAAPAPAPTAAAARRVVPGGATPPPSPDAPPLPPSAAPCASAAAVAVASAAAFREQGYVLVPQAVPPRLVARALARINRGLGTPGGLVAGGVQPGTGKLGGDAATSAELLALFSSSGGVEALAERLLGRGMVVRPGGCQIALRFPEAGGAVPGTALPGTEWHTDGMRQGKEHPFSLLAGVALSEIPSEFCGNFCVFPRTHTAIHKMVLPNGRLKGIDEQGPHATVAADNPWGAGAGLPDLGAPTQLVMQPGDIVLAHPHLAHRGGPNYSPHVRYMVYFRLKHRDHGKEEMMVSLRNNLFADLPGAQGDGGDQRTEAQNAPADGMGGGGDVGGCGGDDGGGGGNGGNGGGALATTGGGTNACGGVAAHVAAATALPVDAGTRHIPATLSFAPRQLTHEQLQSFLKDGVVVVPGILTPQQLEAARTGLDATLQQHGVNPSELDGTAEKLRALSSTNGAGGVLDLFYPPWKLEATLQNDAYFHAVTDIYQASYGSYAPAAATDTAGRAGTNTHGSGGSSAGGSGTKGQPVTPPDSSSVWAHPHGAFDASTALAHVDRIGYRLPEAHNTAKRNQASQKGSRARTLQRSLTPHMDCCPTALHAGGGKQHPRWRPIQCMIALTDTMEPQAGGFECVKGFHHQFETYYAERSSAANADVAASAANQAAAAAAAAAAGKGGGALRAPPKPVVCVGDFCPIRTKEDAELIARFGHVPIPAGAAVFWDQRIPHANSNGNTTDTPRAVIYGGFLPDVPLNRAYAAQQLRQLKERKPQPDFWLRKTSSGPSVEEATDATRGMPTVLCDDDGGGGGSGSGGGVSALPRRLLGLDI